MTDPTTRAERPLGDPASPAVLTTSSTVERHGRQAAQGAALDMGAAAAIWARRGVHVVPFHPRTGAQLAAPMTDADAIAEAWTRDPHAVIGAAVGRAFGLFAIVAGLEDWDLMAQGRPLPGPRWRFLGNGREVALFRWSDICDGIVRPGRLYRAPGVNVLAAGSAIYTPPSPPGGPDLVVITPGEIGPPPAWLLEELAFDGFVLSIATGRERIRQHVGSAAPAKPAGSPKPSPKSSPKSSPAPSPAKGSESGRASKRRAAWARAGIRRELDAIRLGDGAAEALGRAAWALGRFVAGGDLDQAGAEARLWRRARALGLVGRLGEDAVRARIETSLKRGVEAGARQPAEAQ